MRLTLQGARIVDATTDHAQGFITIDGEHIEAIGPAHKALNETGKVIDVARMIVLPGFIDVHTHGGGGYNLHTTDTEEIRSYARWAPTTGATSFLIGVVGIPNALPERQLRTAVEAIEKPGSGSEPLGIHLEGPYISPLRRGAHPTIWLRKPDPAETERILSLTHEHLRLLTMAPELPGASAMIRRLIEAGVTVSIGHTNASYEQAQDAIRLGVTHATHCYNAMPPLFHRAPGPLAAIAEAPQVMGELIADGVHVHPAMMQVLVKILGVERTIVITDALAASGHHDGIFEFAGQQAQVICGAARLADGTLTGSVLTLDQGLRNMLTMTHVSLQEAVRMLTLNPAQAVQVAHRKGLLRPGYDADLLLFDENLNLQATFCRGSIVYTADVWREILL